MGLVESRLPLKTTEVCTSMPRNHPSKIGSTRLVLFLVVLFVAARQRGGRRRQQDSAGEPVRR